jgi:hypothetical protein
LSLPPVGPGRRRLSSFVESDRERLDGENGNRLGFAVGQVGHYYLHLRRCLDRCARSEEPFLAIHEKRLAGDVRAGHGEVERIYGELLLDTEAFFLFAKIMADRSAQLIEFYFGQTRGLSLDTHHYLADNINAVSKQRGLKLPEGFAEFAQALRGEIFDIRDYVTHDNCVRATLSMIIEDRRARFVATRHFFKETDKQVEFPHVQDAFERLDYYVSCVAELLETNRGQSKLMTYKKDS